jgi:hypothetical protein
MKITANQAKVVRNSYAEDDEKIYKLEHTSSFSGVGRNSAKSIGISYSRDTLIRIVPGPRLLDLDDCMFVFHLNRRLAENVRSIRVYANEYKLTDIRKYAFRIEDLEPAAAPSLLFFSNNELADSWITIRPQNESAFHLRFSEHTPKRFFGALEVTELQSSILRT